MIFLRIAQAPQKKDGEMHAVRHGSPTQSAVLGGSIQLTPEETANRHD